VSCLFFVVFVLMAQFVLVNVVVAVLMKHLEVCSTTVLVGFRRDVIPAVTQSVVAGVLLLFLFFHPEVRVDRNGILPPVRSLSVAGRSQGGFKEWPLV